MFKSRYKLLGRFIHKRIILYLWGPCTVDLNNLYQMGVLPRALAWSVFIFIHRVQLTSVIYIVLTAGHSGYRLPIIYVYII